jgi:hypothetical protein
MQVKYVKDVGKLKQHNICEGHPPWPGKAGMMNHYLQVGASLHIE